MTLPLVLSVLPSWRQSLQLLWILRLIIWHKKETFKPKLQRLAARDVGSVPAPDGYNQTECGDGGKGPGLYNAGKIRRPENVTVKLMSRRERPPRTESERDAKAKATPRAGR